MLRYHTTRRATRAIVTIVAIVSTQHSPLQPVAQPPGSPVSSTIMLRHAKRATIAVSSRVYGALYPPKVRCAEGVR